MNNIYPLIRSDREFSHVLTSLAEELSAQKPLPLIVNGLSGGMSDAFLHECIATVRDRAKRISLILVSNERAGRRITSTLRASGQNVLYFPERELVFHNISASHDTERERLFVLHGIATDSCDAVVSTPSAALLFTMPKRTLEALTVEIAIGQEHDLSELSASLVKMGYVRVESVESHGQFAVRGGIVDIFPKGTENPVRIEFFGSEIDRMGYFDIITQRLYETCDSLLLLPAKEIIVDPEARVRVHSAIVATAAKCKDDEVRRELEREKAVCESGLDMQFADKYMSVIYPEAECMLDYISPLRIPVFICDTNAVNERMKANFTMQREMITSMLERGSVISKYAEYSMEETELSIFLSSMATVHINAISIGLGSLKTAGIFGFRGRKTVSYSDKYRMLVEDLGTFRRTGYKTVIVTSSDSEAKSVAASLDDDGIPTISAYTNENFDFTSLAAGGVYISVAAVSSGFELIAPKIAVLTVGRDTETVEKRERMIKRRKNKSAGEKIMSYADLHEGDYVVHQTHGIGMFAGMTTLRTDGVLRDYITINYAGADKLFLPADRLELISKYIGAHREDGSVKLSKLGGTEWQRATSKAKAAAKDMAKELIALYAARQRKHGFSFPADSDMENDFAASFEYDETDPQIAAIEEIKADMRRPVPMDRLLCGDVGFGKTEVAFRAAFKAVCAGKQVAILVPTTILALQHYQTAMSRMRGYPVSVEMLSRFRTAKETSAILRRLKRGEIDIIVGTHKLLGGDVEFKDLGLLIVDEEQRFGVAQKEKIKMRSDCVDVLTLSATPIPRTLNMAMSGIRDMSILDEAPGDRLPVQTYVLEYDEIIIEDAIAKELARKGQVLYLYNKVETIDLVCAKIAKKFPGANVAYAHGQMEHDELEDIWRSLIAGNIDVLICTTIIETGVDLPNANTLIIENADRMGLAQLHQIRGRIGRGGRQAYAYFTYRAGKALSEIAEKRLTAIREYAEFGAGFKIALRDLEIRGAGNLLGTEQHGNIDAVGYDMYIKLLNDAVLEEKGEKPKPPFESKVDIHTDANIPDYYIRTSAGRMEMYKKISLIQTNADRMDVFDELCDRYGDPPIPTVRLLHAALIRSIASKHEMERVVQNGGEIRFFAKKLNIAVFSELFMQFSGMRFVATGVPFVSYRLKSGEDPMTVADKILIKYDEIASNNTEEGPDSGKK